MGESYAETQKSITKECILTALLKLLRTRSFNDISITQITKAAGVSRMAFYRNYKAKEDILTVYLDEMVSEFYRRFSDIEEATKFDILCSFFSFFKERKAFIEVLSDSGLIYLFTEKLNSSLIDFFKGIDNKNKPEYGTYLARFDAGGLYSVLIEWISGGTKESVETMAELICEFTC